MLLIIVQNVQQSFISALQTLHSNSIVITKTSCDVSGKLIGKSRCLTCESCEVQPMLERAKCQESQYIHARPVKLCRNVPNIKNINLQTVSLHPCQTIKQRLPESCFFTSMSHNKATPERKSRCLTCENCGAEPTLECAKYKECQPASCFSTSMQHNKATPQRKSLCLTCDSRQKSFLCIICDKSKTADKFRQSSLYNRCDANVQLLPVCF